MNWFRGTGFYQGHESNVEVEFRAVLEKAVRNGEIPPFHTGEQICLLRTEPDFTWHGNVDVAFYWDGPPHDKVKQGIKDDVQNDYLTRMGTKVIRIHYDGKKVSNEKKMLAYKWLKEVLESGSSKKLWEFDLEDGPIV